MKRRRSVGAYIVLPIVLIGFALTTGTIPAREAALPTGEGRIGVYLTSHAVNAARLMEPILQAGTEGKINALVINVKNMHGELTYESAVPLASAIGSNTGRLDLRAELEELRAQGFYLIARQVLFFDPLLAKYLGLPESWVPCTSQVACEYNLAVAEEVAEFGFDELQFDYIRFSDGGPLEDIYADRFHAVNEFLAEAAQRLSGKITLSADVFGRVLWPWNKRKIDPIGQSLEEMARYLDYISPMVYPSHYVEKVYQEDPYRVVQDAMVAGVDRTQTPIRPFLQAFDLKVPNSMGLETYIREQIRAAEEHGADGFLFWHPACEYDALFRVLD